MIGTLAANAAATQATALSLHVLTESLADRTAGVVRRRSTNIRAATFVRTECWSENFSTQKNAPRNFTPCAAMRTYARPSRGKAGPKGA